MARRPGLWVEIGLSLALLTLTVSVLDAGVLFLASRYAFAPLWAATAETTAITVARALDAGGVDAYGTTIEAFRRAGLKELAVYDARGELIAGDRRATPSVEVRAVIASRSTELWDGSAGLEVAAPVGRSRPEAVVWLRLPASDLLTPAWQVVAAHAVFSAMLIAAFGGIALRRSVITPLVQLQAVTRRISLGDFGATLPEDQAAEIAALAESLNRMSVALAAYRDQTTTQLHRLERANDELRAAQDALVRSERLASVGRLAAGLAHELGNPLTSVRGYLELLVDTARPAPDPQRELLVRTRVEAERMHELLRNLLDFAREEVRAPVRAPVGPMLAEAARSVSPAFTRRGAEVQVGAADGLFVRVEADKVHQVLVSLLFNALDAGAHTVRLFATHGADGVVIRCVDDGHGIEPVNVARVFEPFYTTRPPGHGTGLGLAVAQRVIEQHGGRISVRIPEGGGAEFVITLPVDLEPSPSDKAPQVADG